jgi:hypothetical protein
MNEHGPSLPNPQDYYTAAAHAVMAAFGAMAKWMGDKAPRPPITLLSEMISASFGGTLVFFLASYLGIKDVISYALAGIVGHQGVKGVDFIMRIIRGAVFGEKIPSNGKDASGVHKAVASPKSERMLAPGQHPLRRASDTPAPVDSTSTPVEKRSQ